jgi:hypothetical protein
MIFQWLPILCWPLQEIEIELDFLVSFLHPHYVTMLSGVSSIVAHVNKL